MRSMKIKPKLYIFMGATAFVQAILNSLNILPTIVLSYVPSSR